MWNDKSCFQCFDGDVAASGSGASGSSDTSTGSETSGGESATSTARPSGTETQKPTSTTAQSDESEAPEHMSTTTQSSEAETKDSTATTTQNSETSDEPTTTATRDEPTGTSAATTTSAESTSTAASSKTCLSDINAPGYCEYRKSLPTQKGPLPRIIDHWPQSDGDVEPLVQRTCNAFGVKKGGCWGRTRQSNPKQNTMEDCARLCREEGNCEAFGLYTFDVQMEGGYTCAVSTYKLATEGIDIDVQWSFWWNDLDCFDCYDCNK
ncbi:hypothetical protein FALBO_16670 [Fusarium albosuccineum]|uniref:Apple domain-containing protein n=1 Tax=Fusarium albosuccineum TaxID=1237068 RepID=A0A8H4KHM9_9HYPO|nr:hypothetical protein FALBO_16670 [Fusarium albosuccineum]